VPIPNNVTSIGDFAFWGCFGLTSITSLNPTPPVIAGNTFDDSTYSNAVLSIPLGCKTIYWLQPNWENFKNIQEIEVSGIDNVLIINNKADGKIYNLNGSKMNGNMLGKGIYIKNGKKVVIK